MLTVEQVEQAGGYRVIHADPAWSYNDRGSNGAAENHYPTLSVKQICSLPVRRLAAPDSALLLWATWPLLVDALDVIDAWGFEFKTLGFLWIKTRGEKLHFGLGRYTRGNSEPCLLATRGKASQFVADRGVRQILAEEGPTHFVGSIACPLGDVAILTAIGVDLHDEIGRDAAGVEFRCTVPADVLPRLAPLWGRFLWSVEPVCGTAAVEPVEFLCAPVRRHSAKPPEVRTRIETLFGDVPRIELFARERAPGWDAWGNQVDRDVDMQPADP